MRGSLGKGPGKEGSGGGRKEVTWPLETRRVCSRPGRGGCIHGGGQRGDLLPSQDVTPVMVTAHWRGLTSGGQRSEGQMVEGRKADRTSQ